MKSRSVLIFSGLAYGLTWLLVLPMVLQNTGNAPFPIPVWWHGLGALGPLAAAFMMRRAGDDSIRLKDLYQRQGSQEASTTVRTLILLSPLLLAGLTLLGVTAFSGFPDLTGFSREASRPEWMVSVAVGSVMYGLGEEPGWRGWLLPRLQECRGAVVATLLLSPIWAGWHLPFFFYRFPFDGPETIVGFFIGMLAGAFWLTFVFNSTGGSVWVVGLWHLLWNLVSQIAMEISEPVMITLNALMLVLGFGVLVVWGRRNLTHPLPVRS